MTDDNVVTFPERPETDEYFGGCPRCGQVDSCLNVERVHWFVCHTHRAKWRVGENLFSAWQNETEEQWDKNAYQLSGYDEVEPVQPRVTTCPRCQAQTIGNMRKAHSPLCQDQDGTRTLLSDEVVAQVLKLIHDQGHHIAKNASPGPDEIPF